MSDNTKIEWTDATWNPITGCSVVSPGCTNCYAMHLAGTRLKNHPSRAGLTRQSAGRHVWNGQVRWNHEWLDQPLKWPKRMIFVCAHSDLFHAEVERWMIVEVFGVMIAGHHLRGHIYQVLTKRAERMALLLNDPEFWDEVMDAASSYVMDHVDPLNRRSDDARATMRDYDASDPPPFIWIGVSVEDQRRADERIPLLLQIPAAVRWLSCEPLLGPVSLDCWPIYGPDREQLLSWIVVGGESGTNARPMHPDWARSLRDQCAAAGVPFFFKQWGEYGPFVNELHYTHSGEEKHAHAWVDRDTAEHGHCWIVDDDGLWSNSTGDPPTDPHGRILDRVAVMGRFGKKDAGRLLDGIEHNAFPNT